MDLEMEIIYTSKGAVSGKKTKFFASTLSVFGEIYKSHELIWRFFVREFSAKYKQSFLGILWGFVLPIFTVAIFIILNTSGVLNIGGLDVPYVAYALVGLAIWNFFTATLVNASNSLINAGAMITKINFQKSSLIVSSSGIGIMEFLIRLPLIIVVFIYYRIPVDFSWVMLSILTLVPIYFLALGFGFVLSVLAAVVRDVVIILAMLLNAIMLLTPIMYPISKETFLGKINLWNPMNYLVNTGRDILFQGQPVSFGYWITVFAVCIIFVASLRFFQLAQPKIAERI